MKPARYIFLNRGLEMTPGKCAAQAAHAETLAMHDLLAKSHENDIAWGENQRVLFNKWFGDGHYAKYVMKCNDATQMFTTERYLQDRGFKTYIVVDEGHTEDTWMVPTAMSVELVDKDDERTTEVFSNFRMYKEKLAKPETPEERSERLKEHRQFLGKLRRSHA